MCSAGISTVIGLIGVGRRSSGVAARHLTLLQLHGVVLDSTEAGSSSGGEAHQSHQANEGDDEESTKG